ncbi:MAG: S41 family peptidase, partial [Planctomycetota bacterium]
MPQSGYYLNPTIHGETVVFASDDQLWSVPADGGRAKLLTQSKGVATRPRFSPDGTLLAYSGVEEGYPEVYVMPAEGGRATRLTRLAAPTLVLGWTPDGKSILFTTIGGRSNRRLFFVHTVPAEGGHPELYPVGPAVSIGFGPGSAKVIGRGSGLDPSWWKRYRGGRIGEIWIDREGEGSFEKMIETGGNLAHPLWLKGRIFFHSDHEGVGNIYSCLPSGEDLKRHTDHPDFYLRAPSSDGARVVYSVGGDLHLFDPKTDTSRKIEVDFPSQRAKRSRRFVGADRYLEDYDVHPEGHSLCLTARGKPLIMAHWEGAVRQVGVPGGSVRYRLCRWLQDGKRIVTVSDEGGVEALEIYGEEGDREKRFDGLDIGRPVTLQVAPKGENVLLSNHRGELILVDLQEATMKVLVQDRFGRIGGHDISPDGRFAAFGLSTSHKKMGIFLCDLGTGELHRAAEPVLRDSAPCFDPEGKYLYFLSHSGFDPVRDVLDFAYGFPRGIQLKLVTLRKDLLSPFIPVPKSPTERGPERKKEKPGEGKPEPEEGETEGPEPAEEDARIEIDLEGIERRVVQFPIGTGDYGNLVGLPGGRVLYASRP